MKNKLFTSIVLFFAGIILVNAQSDYYYYQGEKILLTLDRSQIFVIVNENFQKSEIDNKYFEDFNIEEEKTTLKKDKFVTLKFKEVPINQNFLSEIDKLKNTTNIKNVSKFFKRGDGLSISHASNFFFVKLKKIEDYQLLLDTSIKYNVKVFNQNEFMPLWYKILVPENATESSLKLSNMFFETGIFADVDPAFMFDFNNSCANDLNFNLLWGLNNNSNPNIDINICQAWELSTGVGVKVAVLDNGIDKTHNDLNDNISILSYDTKTGMSPSVFVSNLVHGTHIAGTIAAERNNNLQVVGIAPNSSIMSISNELTISPTISEELANGISWAWQNGADIINNSWGDQGGVFFGDLHSTLLEDAILNAINNGRNGLGTIVVFAAGNKAPAMDYPATFHPDILTVGSIMSDGSKSSFSGFGTQLDIVAPGSGIYSTLPNNTIGSLSGTSMAAPHVSGIAALILSVNPNLTGKEVRDIIEKTSQKISSFSYTNVSGRPNGTWNSQVGYGLVDAFAAVVEANKLVIEGSEQICIGTPETYTLTGNIPQGAVINWEYPTNRMYIISGQGTPTITFGAFTPGTNQLIKATVTSAGSSAVSEKTINILSSTTPAIPKTVLAPDNPFNLVCCGQTYTFRHSICSQNCTNIEWGFNIMSQDPNDIYYFNTTTGDITVQKNTYSPLVLSTRARNLPAGCGSPSGWSNSISRYYGVVSSASSTQTVLSSNQEYEISSDLPLKKYFITNENNLYIDFLNLYDWLSFRYGNKNLSDNEVQTILKMLSNEAVFESVDIEIYNFSGAKVFEKKNIKRTNVLNLSQLKSGIHFVKFSSSGMSFSKKIIVS